MKNAYFYQTDIGTMGIAEQGGAVTNVFWGNTVRPADYTEKETPVLRKAFEEISEYLAGKRRSFSVPMAPEGTEFEKAVWQALCEIPYGETRTYGQIAVLVGNPKACRAVGRANSRNPLSILVPCHRVVGASGKLTGYAGGIPVKERLLLLEGR